MTIFAKLLHFNNRFECLVFRSLSMNHVTKFFKVIHIFSLFLCMIGFGSISLMAKTELKKMNLAKISIIVGSTRSTNTGKLIAQSIQKLLQRRSDISSEIIFIDDYHLPFYTDGQSPASRKEEITDPIFKKWSDCIASAQKFIIISPEYNAGYPAALKNALDCLYVEWNHKPVGFVCYSGGMSGGTSVLAQLKQVAQGLEMVPVATSIKIPQSWKAFTPQGDLICAPDIAQDLNKMVDELLHVNNA